MKIVSFVSPNFRQGPREFNAFYLPYSPGVIWSYSYQFDKIKSQFQLGTFIWKRDRLNLALEKLRDSNIVGFSSYIWNRNYNYELARRLKALNPNVLIVFGGPEPAIEDPNFFKNYDFIDLCVRKEGEIVFKNILENYNNRDFRSIKGLLINQKGTVIDTGDSDRISDLDNIPSPYLIGIFDSIIKENPDVTWNAVLETNRGCPYACTFCDWGSLTYNKIKKFNLERVYDDLEWIGKHRCDYISITDANFGIFPERDSLIADKLIDTQNKYGFPKNYSISWAKNQKKEVVNIVKKLIYEGGSKMGLNLSVQTMDEQTLEIIKRKNLETNRIEEVFKLCEDNNIPLFTELILGLPGQTLESYKDDFYHLFNIGNHTGISVYQAQLLENAEMNLLQKKLYKIQGKRVFDYIHGSHEENEIEESIEVVISTKDLPEDDMRRAQVFGWFMNTFHINGLTNYLSRFVKTYLNESYRDFYDKLFYWIQKDLWLNSEIERIRHYYTEWSSKGKINHDPIQNIEIHGFNLVHSTNIKMQCDKMTNHVFDVIGEFFRSSYDLDRKLSDEILDFQKNYVIDFNQIKKYPITKFYSYDFLGYIQTNNELETDCKLIFDFPEDKNISLQRFCEQIFFARRRNFGKSWITRIQK